MKILDGMGVTLNGLDLSESTAVGATFKVNELEGFDELPGTTGQSIQNAYADGGWVDEAFVQPKSVRLLARIWASNRPAATAAIKAFNQAVPVRRLAPLAVSMDGEVRHRMVRQEGEPKEPRPVSNYVQLDVQLSDPFSRILSGDGSGPTFIAGPVGLPRVIGGLNLPPGGFSAPFRIVATVDSGEIALGTEGTATPPVLIRLDGPFPDATIRTSDGQSMTYTEPISAGQWVEINLDGPRSYCKINGTVSRRNRLLGDWIIPADGMVFKFDSSVYNPVASMTLSAYTAWR